MTTALVVVEHDRGVMAAATLEALTAAHEMGDTVVALTVGASADDLAPALAPFGVATVHQARHRLLDDFGPEAWGATIAQAITRICPDVVMATGTDRGNESMAWTAALLDLPFVTNCTSVRLGEPTEVTRVRWGGSLLEEAAVSGGPILFTVAHHSIDPAPAATSGAAVPEPFDAELSEHLGRSKVRSRVERRAGVTLATAPVVVGGGRGVGSAEAFEPLEELAAELGGVVGCSRAVTNNGWRSHTDQVGQTGTRIAPDVYFACGISGAIQHWVGAMASKHIIAINTDEQANMVVKSEYAVIADLHEVVPAITAEVRRRRTG